MRRMSVLVLVVAATATSLFAADMRRPKKLIATGWDKADSERLLKNLAQMETRPFDGVVIAVKGHIDAKRRCSLRSAFHNRPWQREWFQPCVDNLKACKFKRFTDNFVTIGANPGNVDWFDDAGWANIVEHWRIGAWVARQSGFKGILFDPEPYTKPHLQFGYTAQTDRDKHTFNEYYAKARERGRQVMKAIVAEYPDITIYSYFMHIVCSTATGHADPRTVLATHSYGLLPAFFDGWLDVAPPTLKMIDGCEMAYRFNTVSQYTEAALRIKGDCQELVAPENRAKYRAQVQVSFGIYLDAYWNPKDSKWGRWYIPGKQEPRVDQLRANINTALRVADEYVWVYGEKFRWWPTPNKRVWEKSWAEALPGIKRILGFARDPIGYARARVAELQKAGTLVNLARNADFGSDTAPTNDGPAEDWKKGGAPAGWHTWQIENSKGTFTWDRTTGAVAKGAARAANVVNGCFIQSHKVQPGELYAVAARCRVQGKGDCRIRVRWQTPEGQWTAVQLDKIIIPEGSRDAWQKLFGVVEVPEGVGRLVILLGIHGQAAPTDVAWYDDVRLHKLTSPAK